MRRVDAFDNLLHHIREYPLPNTEMQSELVEFLSREREEDLFSLQFRLHRHGVPELPNLEE